MVALALYKPFGIGGNRDRHRGRHAGHDRRAGVAAARQLGGIEGARMLAGGRADAGRRGAAGGRVLRRLGTGSTGCWAARCRPSWCPSARASPPAWPSTPPGCGRCGVPEARQIRRCCPARRLAGGRLHIRHHPAHERHDLRRRLLRGAGVERRLRVVLDRQLDRLRDSRPAISSAGCSAMSIPDETPAAVMILPLLHDPLGHRLRAERASGSSAIQCVVASRPSSTPAAPSSSDPVQTEVVHVVVSCTARTQSSSRLVVEQRAGADAARDQQDLGGRGSPRSGPPRPA